MQASVYIETSVISYCTARPSTDIIVAARQAITRQWWEDTRRRFDLYVSVLVLEEAMAGDQEAAAQRMRLCADLGILRVTVAAEELAQGLLDGGLLPKSSVEDALHIAIATVHGMDYLLTWNFRHINNAEMKAKISSSVEAAGYECPVMCSPEELGGEER